ncbi:MAG: serine hydrolase [Candidatus Thorarchaeota archaeon]|nr:MAG: serine hydrolase [Candidatus Thorarchaeota archaeon]
MFRLKKGNSRSAVRFVAVCATLALLIVPLTLTVPVQSETNVSFGISLPTLESKIESEIEEVGIPSLHASIVINDTVVWAKGFGDQPSLDTVFKIASISKTFTGTAYLQLHEQGLIDLDADVSDYLPFEVRNPNDTNVTITARMLLSHRAGMARDYFFGITPYDTSLVEILNVTVFEPWIGPRPPLGEIINGSNIDDPDLWLSTSNTTTSYSNSGFFFLSFLLEKITNQSFPDYIEENILTPLGMSSTGPSFAEFSGRLAIGHGTREDTTAFEFPHYDVHTYGAGAYFSTVMDMSKYLSAHMNEGSFNGVQLLEPASIDMMHSDDLGWVTELYQGHSGMFWGFMAEMWYNEVDTGRYGILLLINREDGLGRYPSFTLSKLQIESLLHQQGRAMTSWTNLTTTTTNGQGLDLILLGGISGGAAVVVVAAVFILRRRSG